jgi:hypothetical protein
VRFHLHCQGSYEEIDLPTAAERFLIRFPATFYVQEKLLDKIFTSFPHFTGKKKKKAVAVSSTRPSWCIYRADSKSRRMLSSATKKLLMLRKVLLQRMETERHGNDTAVTMYVSEKFILRANYRGHAVALWLKHYATNRKIAGSTLYKVIFTFT